MKKLSIYVLLQVAVTALWYLSVIIYTDKFSADYGYLVSEKTFMALNSIFTVLLLAAIVSSIALLMIDNKSIQRKFEKTVSSNKSHLEIIALTSLIQECDATLFRYDRWEEAGIKGDYMNAKVSVREKMNAYRLKLEQTYKDIEQI
jgi:hypothetical protein